MRNEITIAIFLSAALLSGCKDGKGGSSKYGHTASGSSIEEKGFNQAVPTFESETTIVSVETHDSVGTGDKELKAGAGKTFALVHLKWKNTGTTGTYGGGSVYVRGPDKAEYKEQSDASNLADAHGLDKIAPGTEVERVRAFEVPKADYAAGTLWVYVVGAKTDGYAMPITGK